MEDKSVILLVEDNEDIQKANHDFLELNGYTTPTAATLEEAWIIIRSNHIDIIILDIMLPDGSGFQFCEELREVSDIPVLFLTALGEKNNLIKGLSLGGDDYLVKPYDLYEMLARIEALLRRAKRHNGGSPEHRRLTLGSLTLDFASQRAYIGDTDLLLKTKEFLLLRALAERTGMYATSEELYTLVWSAYKPSDDRALWVHVSGIRKKLAVLGAEGIVIEQKRMAGYRLVFNRANEKPKSGE